jgi:hypothetical protein
MQVEEDTVIVWATKCCSKPAITLPIPKCWLQDHDTMLDEVSLVVCCYNKNNRKNNCAWGGYSAMTRYVALRDSNIVYPICVGEQSSTFCLEHLPLTISQDMFNIHTQDPSRFNW